MENQDAPVSPQITNPMDAAAPGYNWHDNRPSPSADDNEIYVPVPGDEDYVDCDYTISREPPILLPAQSLSAILRTTFATPSVPSSSTQENSTRSGASLSSASAAAQSFRTGAPTVLSGIPARSFAAATVPTLVPPLNID